MDFLIVEWVADNIGEARRISSELLHQQLVACINIIPGIESHFIWEGKVRKEEEILVLMKTKHALFSEIKNAIEEHSSYEVPAILSFSIENGNDKYLSWLGENLKS